MASLHNDAVFPEEDIDDDNETQEYEEEEEEEEEEEDDVLVEPDDDNEIEPSPSTFPAIATVTLALPVSSFSNASTPREATVAAASPEPKRQHTEQMEEKKALDDSRRLFQRLWTDEDEIGLLQGFLEYTAKRGSSHHNDTALFYDQIKSTLQLGFNKNQLVEKLRRLKKKYRNALNKIVSGKELSFKSPHDQAIFEISRKIWSNTAPIGGPIEDDDEVNTNPNSYHTTPLKNDAIIERKTLPSRKRPRIRTEEKRDANNSSALNKDNYYNNTRGIDNNSNNNNNYTSNDTNGNDNCNGRNSVQGLIEETVRSCLSPVLKELVSGAMGSSPFGFGGRGVGMGGFAMNTMPLSFLNLGSGDMVVDEKWRKQQILELEVYSKRLELVQDEIKVALEELRSAGAGGVGNY